MSGEFGFFEQQETQTELGRTLYALIPEGAARVVLTVNVLSEVYAAHVGAAHSDGRVESIRIGGRLDFGLCARLREVMYRPGAGTWFSAVIEVTADGAMTSRFNYDDEPEWTAPVSPIAYVSDQERFPRDEANQPEWLKERLAEGREELSDG